MPFRFTLESSPALAGNIGESLRWINCERLPRKSFVQKLKLNCSTPIPLWKTPQNAGRGCQRV